MYSNNLFLSLFLAQFLFFFVLLYPQNKTKVQKNNEWQALESQSSNGQWNAPQPHPMIASQALASSAIHWLLDFTATSVCLCNSATHLSYAYKDTILLEELKYFWRIVEWVDHVGFFGLPTGKF